MSRSVVIDCFPESVSRYSDRDAIVAIDVIRATTTAITTVTKGRECYPVPSIEATVPLAARLHNPLLVGELGGQMPFGFHVNNSPADMGERDDIHRPAILLSTSGTRVICAGDAGQAMYIACLRNYKATARAIAARHESVALIGAGSRGEFREEDELCCAWLCELLVDEGFTIEDEATMAAMDRWHGRPVEDLMNGASARYLMRSGQMHDLDFVLHHIDDLDEVYLYDGEQIVIHEGAREVPAA